MTATTGPMSGPWTIELGDPYGSGSFLDIYNSTQTVALDLKGFYFIFNFMPQSVTNGMDEAYVCLDFRMRKLLW